MLKDFFTTLGTGALNKVLHAVLVLVIGLLIIRVVTKLLQGGLEKSHLEKAAHSLILSLAKVAMYILLGLSVASSLDIDVTGIVALASVLTLAVSLSLQNMLTNVIGGFTILSTHPFHSGDYVEIAGQSGTVQEINVLRETVRVRIAVGDSFELREYPIDDCQRPEREERKPRVEEEDPAIEDEQSAPQGERVEPAAQPAPGSPMMKRCCGIFSPAPASVMPIW